MEHDDAHRYRFPSNRLTVDSYPASQNAHGVLMKQRGSRKPTSLRKRLFVVAWLISMAVILSGWTVSHIQPAGWQYTSEMFSIAEQRIAVTSFRNSLGGLSIRYNSSWGRHIEFYQTVLKNQKASSYDRSGWSEIHQPFLTEGYISSFTFTMKNHGSDARGAIDRDWQLVVPYWAIALAVLIPGIIAWFIHLRQKRLKIIRRMNGLCLACGYDLRSSIDRCPECGVAITETAP